MIGIICAMSEERDALLKLVEGLQIKKGKKIAYHGGLLDNDYYLGKIKESDIVISRCGVGTVYAAICTSELIRKYKPDLIINLGVAGSLHEDVHVSHIVSADCCANWRFDVPGWKRGFGTVENTFACSSKVNAIVSSLKEKDVHIGPIVSSDEFIYQKQQLKTIKRYYPQALCGEMEGSAIANTCYAYDVDCAIIRSISDETLVSGDFKNFDFNLEIVSAKAAELCYKIIARYE